MKNKSNLNYLIILKLGDYIHLDTLKSFIKHIFDIFMIYIPHN